MPRIETPHFALPLRFNRGSTVCNEQDTIEDIADCVEAILRTGPGDLGENPDFGTPPLIFQQRPLNLDDVINRVELWEPRARVVMEEAPIKLDEALARVRATVKLEE